MSVRPRQGPHGRLPRQTPRPSGDYKARRYHDCYRHRITHNNNLYHRMKATLSFDLNDSDDRRAHLRCVRAEDMALLLWHYEHRLWDRISERIDNLPPPDPEEHRNREWQVVSAVMEEMRIMMHDASINTDDLII